MPRTLIIWICLLVGYLCPAWPALATSPAPAAKPQVAVSIAPQAWLVERLAGGRVEPQVLISAGRSPATYDPSPQEMARLATARLYFSIGVPFEENLLPKLARNFPGLQVVDTLKGIALLKLDGDHRHDEAAKPTAPADHAQGRPDPHVWLSPRRFSQQAETMAAALARLVPQYASEIQRNLAQVQTDLEELDAMLKHALAPLKGSTLLVYHPAFGYLAHDYGLKQEAIETGGRSPGPATLARVIEEAQAEGVKVIFVQAQFPVASAEAVAQAISGTVVPLDPLARDYLANLRAMADRIAGSLR